MELERDRLEKRLKVLVQHNHVVSLIYDPSTGLIDQAPSGCHCTTPRFRNVVVKLEQLEAQDRTNDDAAIVPQPE